MPAGVSVPLVAGPIGGQLDDALDSPPRAAATAARSSKGMGNTRNTVWPPSSAGSSVSGRSKSDVAFDAVDPERSIVHTRTGLCIPVRELYDDQ